jgi:hypothetical protein
MLRGARPAAILLAIAAAAGTRCAGPRTPPAAEIVRIGGELFSLEPAFDDAARTRGLMDRDEIPRAGGMLFVFPDAQVRRFWMENCLVDIDLVFLDPRGRVTATHRMKREPPRRADESEDAYRARLPTYSSVHPAQFAIELATGSIARLGIRFEDRIELDLARLKGYAR